MELTVQNGAFVLLIAVFVALPSKVRLDWDEE